MGKNLISFSWRIFLKSQFAFFSYTSTFLPFYFYEIVVVITITHENNIFVFYLQAAHVGVGISGQEGLQAASASDYAIAQVNISYIIVPF